MPLFILKIKADLEFIQSLTPVEGNLWKFDIQSNGGKTQFSTKIFLVFYDN